MAASGREVFDQSFDFFETWAGDDIGAATDPWSTDVIKTESSKNKALETSFESDVFAFSATTSKAGQFDAEDDEFESNTQLFPEDPFASETTGKIGAPPRVLVLVQEQLAALYDDTSSDGSIQVQGNIIVRPTSKLSSPFCLVLRDFGGQLERIEVQADACHDISTKVPRQGLHNRDRILRVTTGARDDEQIPIATYFCGPNLRPVPMLLKSRVRVSNQFIRVGFKIRANPSNSFAIVRMTIVLAVPPDVVGASVKMSRKGGVWDEMKRTIAWSVVKLDPGEALEVQMQFLCADANATREPMFPILVRCDFPTLFSSIEVSSDFSDQLSSPIRMSLTKSGRVLHRKV